MRIRLVLLALFSATVLRAAAALPLFNATLSLGNEHRFVLVDALGKTSAFLTLGESFDGHRLQSYDPKTGVLVLERDGVRSPVTLVPDAATKAPAESENRRVLQTLAKMVRPQGVIIVGGKGRIMIGGKSIMVGSTVTVSYQQQDYALELAAVNSTEFTLRFRGEEVTESLRPAKK